MWTFKGGRDWEDGGGVGRGRAKGDWKAGVESVGKFNLSSSGH